MTWSCREENKAEAVTVYDNGVVKVAVTRDSLIQDRKSDNEVRLLVNERNKKPVMEIFKNNQIRYRGGYTLDLKKDGYGVEFDVNGVETMHAFYCEDNPYHIFCEFDYLRPVREVHEELSVLSHHIKTDENENGNGLFEDDQAEEDEKKEDSDVEKENKKCNDYNYAFSDEYRNNQYKNGMKKVMIEYSGDKDEDNTSDIVNRCPIYIGEYNRESDGEEMVFRRHGKGKLIDEISGFCIRESNWCNGIEQEENKGDLFNGWYCKCESEESIRCNVVEKAIQSARQKREEEERERKRREEEERKRKEYEESLEREVDIYCDSDMKLQNKLQRGLTEWKIESGKYQSGLTGDMSKFRIEFTNFPLLESVILEGNNFQQVRNFILNGLPKLVSVRISKDCFRVKSNGHYPYGQNPGLFRLTNCPELQTLTIGDNSFCDYTKFELSELPKLETIEFGQYCFTSSDCILKDLPSLTKLSLSSYSFNNCHEVVFENLIKLESIQFNGNCCLNGSDSQYYAIPNINTTLYIFKSMMIMRNLPSLKSISGSGYGCHCMGRVTLEDIPKLTCGNITTSSNTFCWTHTLIAKNADGLKEYIRQHSRFSPT